MKNTENLINQKFGKLTVLERAQNDKYNHSQWICKCSCGQIVVVRGTRLKSGITKSCGCLKIEKHPTNIKHNKYKTRLYRIWGSMKQRCYNPNFKKRKSYLDKGITICEEWKNDFMTFYNWAIKNGYENNLSIDRIDNSKGYYPENCRWATITQQNNNRTNSKKIEYNGKVYTVKELSKIFDINKATLNSRINRGWDIEKALTTLVKPKKVGDRIWLIK